MSGSTKLLVKSIESVFLEHDNTPTTPLSNEVLANVNSFLQKHDTYDSNDSSKLNDELLRVYNSFVVLHPENELVFLEFLNLLYPCIIDYTSMLAWVKCYAVPAIDSASHFLPVVKKAREFIQNLMTEIEDSDDQYLTNSRIEITNRTSRYILEIYLGKQAISDDEGIQKNTQEYEETKRFREANAKELLVRFGSKRSKSFFIILNDYAQQPEYRIRALTLLSYVLSQHHPGSFEIANTKLLQTLINIMLFDESATSVSITVSMFCMIMPLICSSVSKHLSTIFCIYSRSICWKNGEAQDSDLSLGSTSNWERLTYIATEKNVFPDYKALFTMLYGLFPINFLNFIRDPKEQLFSSSYIHEVHSDQEIELIKFESKKLLKSFLIHPNLINGVTIEEELNNPLDWISIDALEDIAASCMLLDTESHSFESRKPSTLSEVLSYTDENFQFKEISFDDPLSDLLNTHERLYSKEERKASVISTTDLKRNSISSRNSSIVSNGNTGERLISHTKSNSMSNASTRNNSIIEPSNGTSIDFYQRELLLLKNELQFNTYVKYLNKHATKKLKVKSVNSEREKFNQRNIEMELEIIKAENTNLKDALFQCKTSISLIENEKLEIQQDIIAKSKGLEAIKNEVLDKYSACLQEKQLLDKEFMEMKNQMDPQRIEITSLNNQLINLKEEIFFLRSKTQKPDKFFENPMEKRRNFVTELEIKLHDLKIQNELLMQENEKLRNDLIVEKEVALKEKASWELRYAQVNMKSEILKHTRASERRIKDLESTISRFEDIIEEKNSKIVQLSTSKPISIPKSMKPVSRPSLLGYEVPQTIEEDDHKKSSEFKIAGKQSNISSSPPVFKGRGGIQNKSKHRM